MRLSTTYNVLVLFLFTGISTLAIAQAPENTPLIDSLAHLYKQNLHTDHQKAKKAAQGWLEASKKADIKLQTARAHYALANLGNISGDYKSTISETEKVISILKDLEIEKGLSAAYNLLALGYKNLGEYPQAIDSFMESLNYSKKDNDKQQEANAYQNIATLYVLQKDYTKATQHLDRAANLYRELKDDDGVLITLFNFANILKEQGDFFEARKHYQTVLDYRIKEGNNAVIAYIYINLSQMLVEEARCEEAVVSLRKTLELLRELEFHSDTAIVLNDLGLCESNLGHTKKAINYFQQALDISEKQALLTYNSEIYKNLSELYEEEGDYKNALFNFQRSVTVINEQNSLDKEKYVAHIQERYETQLKETRIQLLEKEQKLSDAELQKAELTVKRQHLIRNALIVGFILVLLTLIILRHLYVQRLRIQKELIFQQEENAKQKIGQMIKDHRLSVIERYQEGQDEERKRLSRDIHDGIGSDLAGIKIAFEHYAEKHQNNSQSQRIAAAIANACSDVRNLSHQLHPLSFSKMGFTGFLNEFTSHISKKSNIEIDTFFFPEKEINQLPDALLADAYRIIQELITNILKHAQASHADVQLTKHADHLNIVIHDNGKGFQKNKKQGIGLRNIKERLQRMQGTLDIDSGTGNGSSITIDIPLH